jgi:hypothetical protein
MLVPHNFHDRDPSRASAQGVKLDMKSSSEGGGSNVRYYGAKYTEGVAVDLVILPNIFRTEWLLTVAS